MYFALFIVVLNTSVTWSQTHDGSLGEGVYHIILQWMWLQRYLHDQETLITNNHVGLAK